MKKAIGSVIVLALLAAVWWYANREKPVAVELHVIDRGTVERTVSNTRAGTVKACRRSKLSMLIGGRVEILHVTEGDHVEARQLLLELWNEDRKAMAQQARSQHAAARNRREQLCVEADNAAREARRLKTLHEKKLASQEMMELAETKSRAGSFACRAARDEEETAASNVQMNEALLEETYLRAPFEGIVAEINGEVGEYVTPSPPGIPTPPAVDLIDYSCLYVTAPIDEVDAGRIKTGLPVRISLDAFRGEHFEGTLNRIAPYVLDLEKQARTVEVDVLFTNPADRQRLLVGYSADIDVILETRDDVVRIPSEAVLEDETAYRLDAASGRVQLVKLETGIRNWNFTEIVSGLSVGDKVVTSLDQPGLADGVSVAAAE